MPFNLGAPEFLIVLVIVLIVFGAGKLPNVMRDFGRGVKEFRKAQDSEDEVTTTSASSAAPSSPTAPVNGTTAAATTEPAQRTETAPRA
jgi:sec-independent protein translocase protein TatA